ncbi:MAG: hypothetical protein QM628_00350 [Propionicimonas sp.]
MALRVRMQTRGEGMSIWCSWPTIGWEDEDQRFGAIVINEGGEREPVPHWQGGEVRSYADGWSNHYPDGTAERPASVDLASIPSWCVPGHSDELTDDYGRWLRLGIDSPLAVTYWRKTEDGQPQPDPHWVAVVMDAEAVRALRDQLTEWLDAPKVAER